MLNGEQSLVAEAPLAHIPVFLREGSPVLTLVTDPIRPPA
jgi:alpha-glucosidase (family GH31 glycosyl hydrolase)